jgi:hypothetical protein
VLGPVVAVKSSVVDLVEYIAHSRDLEPIVT